MDTRTIGTLTVSEVGLGCNNFGSRLDADKTRTVVHAALDAGVTLFDTADIYGQGLSEEYLGRALGPRRNEVVLATKFGFVKGCPDFSELDSSGEYCKKACTESLRVLGIDHIDLYYMHRANPNTPIEETMRAMAELKACAFHLSLLPLP